MAIDSNSSCEDTFRTCDILVSDFSSMMIEFYPAEKPIIYTHRKDVFNEYAARMAAGVYWVNNEHELSVRRQCELLTIHRSGLYYQPCGEKPENLEIMRIMDEHYLEHPSEGVIRMQDLLLALGFVVNRDLHT